MGQDTTTLIPLSEPAPEPGITIGKRSIALTVLYWLELQAVNLQFGRIKQREALRGDSWWVSVNGQLQGPSSFADVLKVVVDSGFPVAVVHAELSDQDPTPWQTINYRSLIAQPLTARIWTISFWFGCFVMGWFFVCLIAPGRLTIAAPVLGAKLDNFRATRNEFPAIVPDFLTKKTAEIIESSRNRRW